MLHRKDHYDLLRGKPSVQRRISISTTRQQQLAPPFFRWSTQMRVITQQLERATDAQELSSGPNWIVLGKEVEQTLQIAQCPCAYFDARHARARGGLAFLPASLLSRYENAVSSECAFPDDRASRSEAAASATKLARCSARCTSRASVSTM